MPAYPGDWVKVHNKSEQPIQFQWDGRLVTAKPGEVVLVSFEQMANTLGHPASGASTYRVEDNLGMFHWVPSRPDEVTRVATKNSWDLGVPLSGLETLNPAPDVEVWTQDNSERLYTVAEDPAGEHQMVVSPSASTNPQDQMRRLEAQLAALQAQVRGDAEDLTVPGMKTGHPPPPKRSKPDEGKDDVPTDE